jgi:hypothetical protein
VFAVLFVGVIFVLSLYQLMFMVFASHVARNVAGPVSVPNIGSLHSFPEPLTVVEYDGFIIDKHAIVDNIILQRHPCVCLLLSAHLNIFPSILFFSLTPPRPLRVPGSPFWGECGASRRGGGVGLFSLSLPYYITNRGSKKSEKINVVFYW